jgi:anti-anti-sigma regulatory factor
MDCDRTNISFAVEPDRCVLRLEGALGVAHAEELRQAALELCAYRKDVSIDWSGATQIDAGIAQVLLALGCALAKESRSLLIADGVPETIANWMSTAGLASIWGTAGQAA